MDTEVQNNIVSSTSSPTYEQPTNVTNKTSSVQENKISSTVSSDAEAIMLSLIDYN